MRRTKVIRPKRQRVKASRLRPMKPRREGNIARKRKYNFGNKEEE